VGTAASAVQERSSAALIVAVRHELPRELKQIYEASVPGRECTISSPQASYRSPGQPRTAVPTWPLLHVNDRFLEPLAHP
jgi:hypothetical protein